MNNFATDCGLLQKPPHRITQRDCCNECANHCNQCQPFLEGGCTRVFSIQGRLKVPSESISRFTAASGLLRFALRRAKRRMRFAALFSLRSDSPMRCRNP
jgi:hypothetical protein